MYRSQRPFRASIRKEDEESEGFHGLLAEGQAAKATLGPMKTLQPLLLASCLLSAAPMAAAQTFEFELDAAQSSTQFTALFGVDLPGTLIGDQDPVNNPGGTTTLPGLFGGSGNQPVDVDLGLEGGVDFLRVPTGTFQMDVSTNTLGVEIMGLSLDLLGGSPASTDTTLSLLFDTFRTSQPDSLYIGGFPLDIPIGSQSVSALSVEQSAPSMLGLLIPGGNPGEYTFTAIVPVELTMSVEFFGQVIPVGPLELPLPVGGDLVLSQGAAQVTLAFGEMFQQSLPDPLPGFELPDLPFPLPTILPPGGVANLLFTLSIASLDIDLSVAGNFVANGQEPCGFSTYCSANVNSSGLSTQLAIGGSTDVLAGDLTLTGTDLPPNVFGIMIMSQVRDVLPLGGGSEGFLCLGEPCFRLQQDILHSGPAGMVELSVDFNGLPQGQVFLPGSTWNFQLWHRDRNPGPTSNTSQGVSVRFCD